MDRYAADRTVKRLTRRVGITKRISPHSLRHSFITAALDARVPRRNVQEAASHADPRTSMRYDRARQSLDRHATYTVVRQNDERRAPSGRYVVAARDLMAARPGDVAELTRHRHHVLAAPTPDHLLPLFYLAGVAAASGTPATPFVEGYAMGSLSMASYAVAGG